MKKNLSDNIYIYIPEGEKCYSLEKDYVMQVIAPQPEGSIGGSDTHVLELACHQKSESVFAPIVLFKRNYEYELRLKKRLIAYISCIKANDDEIAEALENLNEIINVRIIHSHQYDANFLTQTIKTKCNNLMTVLTVMTCHGWIENNEKDIQETIRDFNSYECADALITVCEKDFRRIRLDQRYINKEMVCIRNGVSIPSEEDMQFDSPAFNYDYYGKKVIIYVGRLAYEKRIDLIIRMFAYLSKLRKDVVLFVIGNGEEKENLVNQVKKENLENRIIFTGFIEEPENAYKVCDLIVLLSETEGTPRSILECMSYGKAAVATNVGGLHEIIDSGVNGILLDSNDPGRCANTINGLLNSPEQVKIMGKNARKTIINKFSVDTMAERVEELYKKIIKEK